MRSSWRAWPGSASTSSARLTGTRCPPCSAENAPGRLGAGGSGVPPEGDLLGLGDRALAILQARRPWVAGRRGETATGLGVRVPRVGLAERDLAVLRLPALAGPE